MSETSSRENNARVEAVTRMSTEKSGCDWTLPYNGHPFDVPGIPGCTGAKRRLYGLDFRRGAHFQGTDAKH